MRAIASGTCAVVMTAILALTGCDRGLQAQSAAGVTQPVRESARPADDTVVTAKVQAALAADIGVSASEIFVETTRGKVTLTGALPQSQIERVIQIARGVDGVHEVDNRLAPIV